MYTGNGYKGWEYARKCQTTLSIFKDSPRSHMFVPEFAAGPDRHFVRTHHRLTTDGD